MQIISFTLTKKVGAVLAIDAPSAPYALLSMLVVALLLVIPIVLVARYWPLMAGKYRPGRHMTTAS